LDFGAFPERLQSTDQSIPLKVITINYPHATNVYYSFLNKLQLHSKRDALSFFPSVIRFINLKVPDRAFAEFVGLLYKVNFNGIKL
jgi:hypothetical protein